MNLVSTESSIWGRSNEVRRTRAGSQKGIHIARWNMSFPKISRESSISKSPGLKSRSRNLSLMMSAHRSWSCKKRFRSQFLRNHAVDCRFYLQFKLEIRISTLSYRSTAQGTILLVLASCLLKLATNKMPSLNFWSWFPKSSMTPSAWSYDKTDSIFRLATDGITRVQMVIFGYEAEALSQKFEGGPFLLNLANRRRHETIITELTEQTFTVRDTVDGTIITLPKSKLENFQITLCLHSPLGSRINFWR